ncbi:basic leucine zipper transcriptional factor ATF-like 2 [Solea senegalensis]|uniref:Basic leucine zipper transcriptional factor ATF-like 2 n=1 Tax=Solea senegalensis TaxID=28829 RepID=A0AAV6R165_SOLSE|nr:mucin-2 [Solea senegalensis]KAG7498016.1 basic leucine zipper transcriptional factor ATF-like 2 [Solea senegalensis]
MSKALATQPPEETVPLSRLTRTRCSDEPGWTGIQTLWKISQSDIEPVNRSAEEGGREEERRRGGMTPSLMDTGDERYSHSSLSAEECNSNTAGSEREGEGQQVGHTGMKRRAKNRDAARRTRRKQTERADELHEELQCLEQANSAFQKEIAALKKDFHHYTDVLAHHEPYCLLRASVSTKSSTVSSLGGGQTNSIPPPNLPQASSSILATPPPVSTSSLLQTLDCVKNALLAPTVTTLLSTTEPASSPSPSNSVTLPHSISFSTLSPPHSLFSKALVTPRLTDVLSHLLSTSMTSSVLTTAAQPRSEHDVIHNTSTVPENACFPTFDSGSLDEFLTSQTSSLTASSSVVPSYPNLTGENGGRETQGCPLNVPQLHSGQYSGDPNKSHPLCTLLPQPLQSPTVSIQTNLEQCPAPAFALKPCYRQMTPSPTPLLSLLTVPSPLNTSQTTSSSDGLLVEPPPSLPSLGDPSTDLSLSELLEVDDWILSGTSNH